MSHHLRAHSHPSSNFVRCTRTCHTKKNIFGRDLKEILRLVICELVHRRRWALSGTEHVQTRNTICTGHGVPLVHGERRNMIIDILNHFCALETTLAERQYFRALAELVRRCAARLSACDVATIVSKMGSATWS